MTSDLMFWYYILSNPTIEKKIIIIIKDWVSYSGPITQIICSHGFIFISKKSTRFFIIFH